MEQFIPNKLGFASVFTALFMNISNSTSFMNWNNSLTIVISLMSIIFLALQIYIAVRKIKKK